MRADLIEAIQAEEQAHVLVIRLAEELADAARPIAHQGDGNCGAVIQHLLDALRVRGLYKLKAGSSSVGYKKKPISHELQKLVFERNAYRCVQCKTHIDLCVDHIKPECKGGTLDIGNLQTLCRTCNSIKGSKA
jgi:HNH endonuclease